MSMMLVYQMPHITDEDVDKLLAFVRAERHVDLSGYRKSFLGRRLIVRYGICRVTNIYDYLRRLKDDVQEWDALLENLCINVSEFFRDISVFDSFAKNCLSQIVADAGGREINLWSCGCSCGEEAYTLAILCREFWEKHYPGASLSFNVTATDIDADALAKARRGVYNEEALANVDRARREKYFTLVAPAIGEEIAWQVREEIRRKVSFERHDIVNDGVLGGMDAVFLRNVRIYFHRAKAKEVLVDVHRELNPGGYLVLGRIESIGLSLRHIFASVDAVNRIYKKI